MSRLNFTIQKNGLGIQAPSVSRIPLVVGTATSGPCDSIQAIGSGTSPSSIFGAGKLVDQVALYQAAGVSTIYAARIFSGTWGSVTHTGTGPANGCSVAAGGAGGPLAPYSLVVKIILGGVAGTATFQYSLDGGNTYSGTQTIPTSPYTFQITDQGIQDITLTFGSGTYVTADTYAATASQVGGTIGTLVQTGPNDGVAQGAGQITPSGTPVDAYEVVIQVLTTGAKGVATIQISLDAGNSFGPSTTIPSSSTIPIGENSEVTLTFANTGGAGVGTAFQAGDVYSFTTTGPTYALSDVTNCYTILFRDPREWGFTDLIGEPASNSWSVTASLATTMDGLMTTYEGDMHFAFAMIGGPADTTQTSTDSAAITAFQSLSLPSLRLVVCAGDAYISNPAAGNYPQRNCRWVLGPLTAMTPAGVDVGWVGGGGSLGGGPVPGVLELLRDENATPALDVVGFTTLCTVPGAQGVYFFNARIMGGLGTDFTYLVGRRVMDEACIAARNALNPDINGEVDVSPSTGYITSDAASAIELSVDQAIINAAVTPGDAVSCSALVNRTADILSTENLPITISIVPKGYSRTISATIGFTNPAFVVG